MRTYLLLLVVAASPGLATARPSITLEDAVPFTEDQLAEAIGLRVADARAEVKVSRRADHLVVSVGDRSDTVAIASADPHANARTVAMMVVALAADEPAPAMVEGAGAPVVAPSTQATPARLSGFALAGLARDDGGTFSQLLTGALAYHLAPSARVIGSVTLGEATVPRQDAFFLPVRLGVEGRAGAIGLELGGMVPVHRDCSGSVTASYGGYVTGRIYVPLAPTHRLVVEAGGYYLANASYCGEEVVFGQVESELTSRHEAYGGHIGGGVEWAL